MKKTIGSITAAQFEEAMEKYAAATRKEAYINKQIEIEVNELLENYEHELLNLAQDKQTAWDIAYAYCRENKEQLFMKRRSIGTSSGIAGFRLGTPRLSPVKGNSWKNVLKELKEKLPAYVRTVEEPAKDRLLADRYATTVAPVLMTIGVQVLQDDLFYIESRKAA